MKGGGGGGEGRGVGTLSLGAARRDKKNDQFLYLTVHHSQPSLSRTPLLRLMDHVFPSSGGTSAPSFALDQVFQPVFLAGLFVLPSDSLRPRPSRTQYEKNPDRSENWPQGQYDVYPLRPLEGCFKGRGRGVGVWKGEKKSPDFPVRLLLVSL